MIRDRENWLSLSLEPDVAKISHPLFEKSEHPARCPITTRNRVFTLRYSVVTAYRA